MQCSDTELIRRIRQGDAAAWRDLVGRHLPSLWRYVRSKCDDRHLAEDIAAETMVALVRELRQSEPCSGNLSAWLTKVAHHKCVDHWRKKKRQQRGLKEVRAQIASADNSKLSRDLVAEALESMAADERLVLEWKYFDSLSVQEIAKRMGRTEKAIASLLYRARNSFRKIYDKSTDSLGHSKGTSYERTR